jgi:hypothetical protein
LYGPGAFALTRMPETDIIFAAIILDWEPEEQVFVCVPYAD